MFERLTPEEQQLEYERIRKDVHRIIKDIDKKARRIPGSMSPRERVQVAGSTETCSCSMLVSDVQVTFASARLRARARP